MANNEFGKGAQALLMLAAAAVVACGIKLAAGLIAPLLVAGCIAVAVQPIFRWVHSSRIPDVSAVVISLLVIVGLVAVTGGLMVVALADLSHSAAQYGNSLHQLQGQVVIWLEAHGQHALGQSLYASRVDALLQEGTTAIVMGVPAVLSTLLTVLLLIVFMLLEVTTLPRRVHEALGWSPRTFGDFARTMSEIQRYLSVKTATSAATGVLAGACCFASGVPNAALWGLVTFALHYVPTVGSLVAAIPPVLIALTAHGAGRAAILAAGLATVSTVIGNIIEPNALGRSLSVSPLMVLLSMFGWGYLLGPTGALLSVPLTLIVKIVAWNTSDLHWVAVLIGPTPQVASRPTQPGAPRDSLLPVGSARPNIAAGRGKVTRPESA